MKTGSKHEQEDIQLTKNALRQLFALQMKLEDLLDQDHNDDLMIKRVIDLIDELFEKIMRSE